MGSERRNRVLENIVSPYGLATVSYGFFLLACLLPPTVYSYYMHEPDLMFLDPATILFYSLCVGAFIAGVWLVDAPPAAHNRPARALAAGPPLIFLLAPLLAGILLTGISSWRLLTGNPQILWWLLTQQGGNLKGADAPEIESIFTLPPLLLIASTWFVFWRLHEVALKGWRRWLVNLTLLASALMVVFAAVLTLSRNLLMMLICGLAILYILRRTVERKSSVLSVLGGGALFAACAVLLFAGVSFLRGTDLADQLSILLQYTVASYNRLAAVLHGQLRYPFAGHGVYLSSFLSFSHLFNQVVPLAQSMNWPSFQEVWNSEFGAVSNAGLDGRLIWSGTFGYIFSDLGWLSPLLLFAYGIVYGLVWNWVRRGRLPGILIYPGMGFCVLFWIGTNYLFDSQTVFLYFAALLLCGYDHLFTIGVKAAEMAPLPQL